MNPLMDSASSASPETTWSLDGFAQDPGYLAYRNELRVAIFNTAQTAAPTREASPNGEEEDEQSGARDDDDAAVIETRAVLSDSRRIVYFKNYIAEVAPWLDMFDSAGAFTNQVPVLARGCPALLYAILALSARQMERQAASRAQMTTGSTLSPQARASKRQQQQQPSFDSLELYQAAIRRLTPLLQAHDLISIPTCVVLCCLEMMSASPRDWRRHLAGCAALFDAYGVHGFCGGLLQSVFWCYARMDLCAALISDGTEGTLVPLAKWLPPGTDAAAEDDPGPFCDQRTPDMHANYAVYLCARACRLVADHTRHAELGEDNGCDAAAFRARWLQLWAGLAAWVRDRPPELVPVHVVDGPPFPQVLFVHWAAISAMQLYHTACIILLEARPRDVDIVDLTTARAVVPATTATNAAAADDLASASAIWHAKRICGISLTNPHRGCLNNAIQPLWVAGRLLSHRSEHEVLVRLIRSIESMTGWATSWRIADLETAWGYRVG